MEFKMHDIDLYIVDSERNTCDFEAYEGDRFVAGGTGYMNYVLADKAAIRELTYMFGNRYTVTYR